MVRAKGDIPASAATSERKMEFNREVMKRVALGVGGKSRKLGTVGRNEFDNLVRGGAEYYVEKYGATFDRSRAERHRMPVDDDWQPPLGGRGKPERGFSQLGSLGGGNHFIELQRCEETQALFVRGDTGRRGWGDRRGANHSGLAATGKSEGVTTAGSGYF